MFPETQLTLVFPLDIIFLQYSSAVILTHNLETWT